MANPGSRAKIQRGSRFSYRLRSRLGLLRSSIYVAIRRLFRGSLLPGWSYRFETGTNFLRQQQNIAFEMPDIARGQEYLNALFLNSPSPRQVSIEAEHGPVQGLWFIPKGDLADITLLYLPGFEYGFRSKFHDTLVAWIALAAKARTFALHYRQIPEHPYPAQLEDVRQAHRWLLDNGIDGQRIVVAGDSAGGNLVLALLLCLREDDMPLPGLAVCLSPWVDMSNSGGSMTSKQSYDWVQKRMLERWAAWYCNGADPGDPHISPLNADLHGFPPIYIQAGDADIFFDMIRQFNDAAHKQEANVSLEVWEHMNHKFQAYGDQTRQSKLALAHIQKTIERAFRDKAQL